MVYSKEEALGIMGFADADGLEEWMCRLILRQKKLYEICNRNGLTINNSSEKSFLMNNSRLMDRFNEAYYIGLILNLPIHFRVSTSCTGGKFLRTNVYYNGYEFCSINDYR